MFTVIFLIMSVWLTAEIYYMGQWSFGEYFHHVNAVSAVHMRNKMIPAYIFLGDASAVEYDGVTKLQQSQRWVRVAFAINVCIDTIANLHSSHVRALGHRGEYLHGYCEQMTIIYVIIDIGGALILSVDWMARAGRRSCELTYAHPYPSSPETV